MIKNIVFDIGKVLAFFEPEQHLKNLGYDDITRQKVMSAVFESSLWEEVDRGVMSTEELTDAFVANAPEYEMQIREAFSKVSGTAEIMPYTMKWVEKLKAQGYHLYVISNYGQYPYEETKHKFKFLSYMDGVIVSYQYKIIKPDRRIYETLLQKYHLKAEECVFIDDRSENVEGARALGFKGIQFKDYEQASGELNQLLLQC